MKSDITKLIAAVFVAFVFSLGGCSKSSSGSSGDKKAGGEPSLQEALSSSGQKNAALAALPKGNPDTPLEQYTELSSGNQLMFMYYGLLNMPVDYDKIAQSYSRDYRNTNDEFKKHDILAALKPRIDAEIIRSKDIRYFKIEEQASLGHFDFKSKSFQVNNALGPDAYGYFNDNSTYQYGITNGDKYSMLKVADEGLARNIESMINKYPPMKLVLYLYTQDADPNKLQIKCQLVKAKLVDSKGNELLVQ